MKVTCKHCGKKTKIKKFSILWLLLLGFLTGGIGAIIYVIWYTAKKDVCEHCGRLV